MGKRRAARAAYASPRPLTWGRVGLGALLVVALSGAVFWGLSASSGTPRLVVDRTEVDLGYRSFDIPARVVFTLTNAGDGSLRLKDAPRVIVKAGC